MTEELKAGSQAIAQFDFSAADSREISVSENDHVEVLEVSDQWVLVRIPGRGQGFVPLSYLAPAPPGSGRQEPFGDLGSPTQELQTVEEENEEGAGGEGGGGGEGEEGNGGEQSQQNGELENGDDHVDGQAGGKGGEEGGEGEGGGEGNEGGDEEGEGEVPSIMLENSGEVEVPITVGCIVVAIDDFTAEADQELSVTENERLRVLSIDDAGWCTAESEDRGCPPGLVPLSYLKFAESQDSSNFTVRTSSRRMAKEPSSKDKDGKKGVISFTYVITEPSGPPKRVFYDEILDPLERQRVMNTLTDRQKAYQQAAYEIYVTEVDYVKDMQTLVDVFYQPMMMEKSISTETAQGIFTEHIPSLLGVHEILLKNLKLLREKGLSKSGMAKVFEKLANAFQNYGYYFVNHASAIKLLTRKKENRSFANFIKTCEANPQCKNLSIQSYLIKPIQRLTKYPLLLKELLDHCDDPEEGQRIGVVLDKIVKIVTQLNEEQRLTENRELILDMVGKFGDKNDKRELLEKLSPKPDFLNKDSLFHRHGKATMIVNGKQSDTHLYLFNDYLICGKRSVAALVIAISKLPLKVIHFWPTKDIVIRDGAKKGTFEIRDDSGKQICAFNPGDEFLTWKGKFEELGLWIAEGTYDRRDSELMVDPRDLEHHIDRRASAVRTSEMRNSNTAELDEGDTSSTELTSSAHTLSVEEIYKNDRRQSSTDTTGEEDAMIKERSKYRSSIIVEYQDLPAELGFGFAPAGNEEEEEEGEVKEETQQVEGEGSQANDDAPAAAQEAEPPVAPEVEAVLKENAELKEKIAQLENDLAQEKLAAEAAKEELRQKTSEFDLKLNLLEGRLQSEVSKNKQLTSQLDAEKTKAPKLTPTAQRAPERATTASSTRTTEKAPLTSTRTGKDVVPKEAKDPKPASSLSSRTPGTSTPPKKITSTDVSSVVKKFSTPDKPTHSPISRGTSLPLDKSSPSSYGRYSTALRTPPPSNEKVVRAAASADKAEKIQKVEKVEKTVNAEKAEKPEKVEKVEKAELALEAAPDAEKPSIAEQAATDEKTSSAEVSEKPSEPPAEAEKPSSPKKSTTDEPPPADDVLAPLEVRLRPQAPASTTSLQRSVSLGSRSALGGRSSMIVTSSRSSDNSADSEKSPLFPSKFGQFKSFRRSVIVPGTSSNDMAPSNEITETLTKLQRRASHSAKRD